MAVSVRELRSWLKGMKAGDRIGIDDGGLTLRVVDSEEEYYEIGGLPEPEGTTPRRVALSFHGSVVVDITADSEDPEAWSRAIGAAWDTVSAKDVRDAALLDGHEILS